jgi:hypothetical protein
MRRRRWKKRRSGWKSTSFQTREYTQFMTGYMHTGFVAVRRFLDNIIIQVVERHLLGPYGPLKIFSGELLDGLNDDELEKLAGEDENKMNERKAIQERVHGLEDALRKAAIAVP